MRIVFVCFANMCRSAMAEGLARKLAQERELPEPVIFTSAGLGTNEGLSALPQAAAAAATYGVSLDDHETTPFNLGAADGADYVIAMTRAQKAEIIARLPVLRLRTYTLAEFVRERTGRWPAFRDVDDPTGGSPEGFRKCARLINDALTAVLDSMAGKPPPRRSILGRLLGR